MIYGEVKRQAHTECSLVFATCLLNLVATFEPFRLATWFLRARPPKLHWKAKKHDDGRMLARALRCNERVGCQNRFMPWCDGRQAGTREDRRGRLVGQFSEQNARGWRNQTHLAADERAVVTITHPGRANWCNPSADPTPFVRDALARCLYAGVQV